ncbi:MAG TPA: LPS export ABC transporter permease LptF [Methylococcaceae bacterium]|nr:LPS export ABC transporter permease LptF [Methylococcaceae bacterium]
MINLHPAGVAGRPRQRWFTVLDRLIMVDVLRTTVAVLAILVLIIVSKRFLRILARAIEGQVSGEAIFLLLGLKISAAAIALLPSALFAAVLMTLGRMYRDYEMPVLAASGVGVARIYRAVMQAVLPLALLGGALALNALPWIEAETQRLFAKEERTADLRVIKEGKFAESSDGNTVFYVEKYEDRQSMRNIFVQSHGHGKQGVVTSASGYLKETGDGEQYIILKDGIRYEGAPGQGAFVITEFDEYGVRIQEKEDNGLSESDRRNSQSSQALLDSGNPKDVAEFQKRLAVPLGIVALTCLAVPLSRVAPRSGVYGNLFAAFLIYLAYENAQRVTQGLLISAKIAPALSYVLVYGLMGLGMFGMLIHELGWFWVKQCLTGGWRPRR